MSYLLLKWLRKLQYLYNCRHFDRDYYLEKYPDIAKAGIDPLKHYKQFGQYEGRYSSLVNELESTMDRQDYLKRYPDVAKSRKNPITHYLQYGRHEGRVFKRINEKPNENPSVLSIIKNSPYWDEGWYLSYYCPNAQTNSAEHYLRHGFNGVNPGPFFYSAEYLLLHPDVKAARINPLLHYESFGQEEGRSISLAAIKEYQFPNGAESFSKIFRDRTSFDKHIVTVLASFSSTSKVEDYVLYLLKGLREISDYVVFACDNPLFPEEISKLEQACDVCLCERHKEYDFGSYKRGFFFLEEHTVFTDEDELLLINDSNYGPVYPFKPVLEKLHKLNKDFYGLTSTKQLPVELVQSFFYLFSPRVRCSEVFRDFFKNVKKEISRKHVVFNAKMKLTKTLSEAGFSWGTLIPEEESIKNHPDYVFKYNLTLLKDWSYPLVRIKSLLYANYVEDSKNTLKYIHQQNPELYNIIIPHLNARKASVKDKEPPSVSSYTLREHYSKQISRLREKCQTSKLKVVFLVNMSSMFPAQGLMEKMLNDDMFEVELYVIPDVRFGDQEMLRILNETYSDLSEKYTFAQLAVELVGDEITAYHDVVKGADLVCYPSPYDASYSLYNPYYATQNHILSLYIVYGFAYGNKYDRFVWQLYNFNNFWKVFLETEYNYEEYRKYGRCEACNAEVVGYAKMDRLATIHVENPSNRKKIIIAPHHSIDGGANNILRLSNFLRYAKLFIQLPQDYPDIDFIFRPHPALFIILRQDSHWGNERCDEYLKRMCALPNVEYSTNGDYMEVFAQSDGIIQDCASFLIEYLYVGKPCCYMLREEKYIEEKFINLGKVCLKNYYIAYEEEDIRRFLDDVIVGGNDPLHDSRETFRRDVLMLNYPHVTDTILEKLKKQFSDKY